jgi:hypothetical protein
MDWNVRVVTKSNQIKTVRVNDYIYASDAIDAALAQTDAVSVINCGVVNDPKEVEPTPNQIYDNSPRSSYDYNWDNNQFYQYAVVTLIPSLLLWIVSPVLCCIFNAVLCYWWFKK